jgi:hypothetical protein
VSVRDRIRDLTGFGTDELLALEGFDAATDDAVVYLSGSLVSGHANPWSDIDLFAVTDRAPLGNTMRADTNLVIPHFVADRRADYEFWTPAKVAEMADRLARYELGTGVSIPGASFMQIEKIFIHRVRVGVPLCNEDGFAELQAQFDWERFAAFLTEEAMRHLDSELEDLVGMRKGGDRDSALWVARQTVDVTIETYLHSLGNTDPVHKWQVRYLADLDESPRHQTLRDDYWRLAMPDRASELRAGGDGWHAFVEEVIAFANRVAAWVQG